MNVKVEINSLYDKLQVILRTNKITEEVEEIKTILETYKRSLNGYRNDKITILQLNDIYSVYAYNQKIFAKTENGEYLLKMRLYEAEEILIKYHFLKISRSEIININKIKEIEYLYRGLVKIIFISGESTFVSRRFVGQLKNKLGV